ncbi:hypothetical protein H310_14551 [Aphanomyces invadans]|uniref:Uncharacterized protein n=1 Tax=Aphanomyces invadans TaxID=157072 RepID=A0A024TBH4_9STRA|nr:hypothetical protein H310_14551 [Aphanomyces invadans]ETV90712.1 hypothetical protein H310_14551 [Aphanomyces invadans]|eukprot:XP_008880652.1 hypothetical protein H310_14551 [Aphanomyces invadans]
MEVYLRGAPGWRHVPPVLEHIAACRASLLEDLVAQACDRQSTADLVQTIERAVSITPSFDLSDTHIQNAAAGLVYIARGLALQNLSYPSTSPPDSSAAAVETAGWEATLDQLESAMGNIPHRQVIAMAFLKRWKRQLKPLPSSALPRSKLVSPPTWATLVKMDCKLRVAVAKPSAHGAVPDPQACVRIKWEVAASSSDGNPTAHVVDLTVAEFQDLYASWQALAVAVGEYP